MKKFLFALFAVLLLASVGNAAQVTQTATFRLTWTDNSNNEDQFNLYRCTGAGCSNFALVKTVGANITTVTDSIAGDTGNITYRYRLTANNGAGESAPTNIVDAVSSAIIVIPGAPTGLIASMVGVTIP